LVKKSGKMIVFPDFFIQKSLRINTELIQHNGLQY
jgi:hypothetical protein